jgi:Tol biopolymer transport system component
MNSDGTGLQRVTTDPAPDYCPEWSPDGDKVAFFSTRRGTADIFLAELEQEDGQLSVTEGPLTGGTAHDSFPTWSPDGSKIAFVRIPGDNMPTDIWVMTAAGDDERNLTKTPEVEELWPDWR